MKNIAILLLIVMIFSLSGCVTTEPVQDSTGQPVVTETPTPEPTPEPAPQTGYAVTTDLIFEIIEAKRKVITDLTADKKRDSYGGFGDPINGNYLMFTSFFLTNTKELSEKQADMDGVLTYWKDKLRVADAQLFHDAPHNYRLTGTWPQQNEAFEVICRYDPDTGALQAMCNQNGRLRDSLEFKPLGDNRYALQHYSGSTAANASDYEKALITYKDGKILDFHYRSLFITSKYRCIYPDGQGLDKSWIKEDNVLNETMEITYDGSKLTY